MSKLHSMVSSIVDFISEIQKIDKNNLPALVFHKSPKMNETGNIYSHVRSPKSKHTHLHANARLRSHRLCVGNSMKIDNFLPFVSHFASHIQSKVHKIHPSSAAHHERNVQLK